MTALAHPAPWHSGPRRRVLLALVLAVLVAHAAFLLGAGSHLLSGSPGLGPNTTPLHTRLIVAEAPAPVATPARSPAARHTPARPTARLMPPSAAQPPTPTPDTPAAEPQEVARAPQPDASEAGAVTASGALPATAAVDPMGTPVAPPATSGAEGPRAPASSAAAQASVPVTAERTVQAEAGGAVTPATPAGASTGATPQMAAEPAAAGQGLPLRVSPAHLPPPVLLSYDMTGQDKGLRYHASGELQWQHDGKRYALTLSVRAFLVGARHWRSRGNIGPEGLEPARFSDTRRSELAAHFDRANQRVVFSNNAPAAPLQPGAQDQISLYVQLAAAMNGQPEAFAVGRAVQLQTATVRDALPWQLTLEQQEVLQVNGQPVTTFKWVCLPRQRFDSRIEFWSSPQHHGLPARIRITQASGSYIDMQLRGLQSLPALAAEGGLGEKTTSP